MKTQTLFDILEPDEIIITIGSQDVEISGFQIDSRKVKKNEVFVAVKGSATDGHDYIDDAIYLGANVIICEQLPEVLPGITYFQLVNVRKSVGTLVNHFYGNERGQTKIIGVTGTNGKSTVVTLLYQLFTELGYKVGLLSTVENRIGHQILNSTHTTPDVISLAMLLRDMREADCAYIFMEVSSHGLDQDRVAGVPFDGAVFTNISHDHLDYHGTMLAYINAKKKFFDYLDSTAFALVNLDDKNGSVMLQNCNGKHKTYALRSMADYRVRVLQDSILGLHLRVNDTELYCKLSGEFNAYNIGAAYGVADLCGEDTDEVLKVLSRLDGAEGRMQRVTHNATTKIGIVDYAHTPDALENVLKTLNNTIEKRNNIITVIGCGGERDKTKRPLMASIAAKLSGKVVLTADNPRSEDAEDILDDMDQGVTKDLKHKVVRITDRKAAIKTAVLLANEGDIILVAGKGHEKYQEIKGKKFPFEDKEMLLGAFMGNI